MQHTRVHVRVTCLLQVHNISYMMRLMRRLRQAIADGLLPAFVQEFMLLQVCVCVRARARACACARVYTAQHLMLQQFPDRQYPGWVVDALASVDITLKV